MLKIVSDEGGGGGGFQFGGMHIGIGGALVLLVLSLIFKQNFFALLGGGSAGPATTTSRPDASRDNAERPLVQFVSFVLDDTQKTWTEILPEQANKPYHHAKLVLFRNYTQSGCGGAESATGPFYCPGDEKVYIDLGFYDELKQRFGAPGEFAQAYVLAHEIGHHVRIFWGSNAACRATRTAQIPDPCIWSCRRTVSRESGRTLLSSADCWRKAMSSQRWVQRQRLATIAYRRCPLDMLRPILSPTAHQSSE